MIRIFRTAFVLVLLSAVFAHAQDIKHGTLMHIKVHGKGLEGNLEGDSTDRGVAVYLPPGYAQNPKKRYPVVYFLHGFTDDEEKFYGLKKHWMNLKNVLDTVYSAGKVNEMIFVTPNAYTKYKGSMYSNSVVTGNWEDYVAKELVAYIDTHYRTIAKAESRGLCGHSMGGYGTMRIGSKHPEIFSSIYLISPASLQPDYNPTAEKLARLDAIKTPEDAAKADFGTMYSLASAAAWSPNPGNGPLNFDLPIKNGQLQNDVYAKWIANMPLVTLDQYIGNLKQLHAIGFDAGTKDRDISASIKVLDEQLTKYGIKHQYESYYGTHIDHVAERFKLKIVQFFSDNLNPLTP
jgi:S-formylglutathione hydrolase